MYKIFRDDVFISTFVVGAAFTAEFSAFASFLRPTIIFNNLSQLLFLLNIGFSTASSLVAGPPSDASASNEFSGLFHLSQPSIFLD